MNFRTIENLKGEGRFFHAGALAATLGLGPSYGCHYGMRSSRFAAMAEFEAGFYAADLAIRRGH